MLNESLDHEAGMGGHHAEAIAQKRNLVMFMPDQLRYDSLGCTGNPVIKTPHFDALAGEGTLFTNCFAQASVCTQSRCSMFTGQYLHTNAHRSIDHLLQIWEDNMFKILKDAGYTVCSISPRGDMFAPGVTELSMNEYGWVESPPNWPPKYSGKKQEGNVRAATIEERMFFRGVISEEDSKDFDHATITSALRWLKASPPEPFCLFLPLFYPHVPFQVKEPYYAMYQNIDLPPRVKLSDKTGFEPAYMQAMRDAHGLERATEAHWKEAKAVYYGMITRLDDQLGEIIDVLKSRQYGNLWDRTYTMVYTDHGEYLGDSDMIEKWPSGLHDVLVHDPLIIAGPDLPQRQVNEALVEMVDLVPTVLELLGIPERYPHSGESLVPVMRENRKKHKQYAFSEGGFLLKEEPYLEVAGFPYDRKAGLQHENTKLVGRAIAARDKDWAYTYRLYEPAELFNRQTDPGEAHNVAEDPGNAAVVLRFERAILRWMASTSDYVPWTLDPRFPEVNLESTASVIAKRERAGGRFNH